MKSSRQAILLLMAGSVLMLFSNGRWSTPIAGWIYPVFFLRFMYLKKPWQGFLLLCLATGIANYIMWWRMIPVPGFQYFLITFVFFQVINLSYLATKLVVLKGNSFLTTLIFPFSYCILEYLSCFVPAKGTWGVLGYSQAPDLAIMQLASLTGIWGISFLMLWFASVLHWSWTNHFGWKIIKRGWITFGATLVGVFLFGFMRLLFPGLECEKLVTASIVQKRGLNDSINSCRWTDARSVGNYSDELEQSLLDNSEKAARAGAKIVLWQESAGFIPKSREVLFIQKARLMAAEYKIYLLMTLWSIPENFPVRRVENKLLVINHLGQIECNYIKNFAAPPEPIIKGDGQIPTIHTRYGIIAPAICADADYPAFIRQSSRKKVDIMFIPANDWKAIDPLHTYMATTRAIENGFTLVRPTGQGLSVATDNKGRVLATLDYYKTQDQIMYAEIPLGRSWTFYGWAGDYFPMGAFVFLLAMALQSILKKKRSDGNKLFLEKFSPGV